VKLWAASASRILAIWPVAIGCWFFTVFVALSGWSWSTLAICFALAAGVTWGTARLVRYAYGRSSTRPLPTRGFSGWLARQPGWQTAIIVAMMYLVPWAVVMLDAVRSSLPVPFFTWLGFGGQVIFAAGFGTFQALVMRRQCGEVGSGP
jgi:hypothetical protein